MTPPSSPQALYDIMPDKAKTMMDRLIKISQDAVFKLEGEPTSTLDYVNLLRSALVFSVDSLVKTI